MTAFLSELAKILQMETTLYHRLLEVMGRERAAMLRSHLREMGSAAAEKDLLIEQLRAAEERRTQMVDRLAERLGCPSGEATLSLLARTSPAPHGAALRRCQTELLDLVAQVKHEIQRSEVLCRHAGDLLRASYGVLKGLAANGFVYQRGGRLHAAPLHGKLVCDEI
jgi:flagellar biosynthesis/type III secretory pathway chaperone